MCDLLLGYFNERKENGYAPTLSDCPLWADSRHLLDGICRRFRLCKPVSAGAGLLQRRCGSPDCPGRPALRGLPAPGRRLRGPARQPEPADHQSDGCRGGGGLRRGPDFCTLLQGADPAVLRTDPGPAAAVQSSGQRSGGYQHQLRLQAQLRCVQKRQLRDLRGSLLPAGQIDGKPGRPGGSLGHCSVLRAVPFEPGPVSLPALPPAGGQRKGRFSFDRLPEIPPVYGHAGRLCAAVYQPHSAEQFHPANHPHQGRRQQ